MCTNTPPVQRSHLNLSAGISFLHPFLRRDFVFTAIKRNAISMLGNGTLYGLGRKNLKKTTNF